MKINNTLLQITTIKPKYIPLLCPSCRGHRTVNWGRQVCGVCDGEGFLKVPPVEEGDNNEQLKR